MLGRLRIILFYFQVLCTKTHKKGVNTFICTVNIWRHWVSKKLSNFVLYGYLISIYCQIFLQFRKLMNLKTIKAFWTHSWNFVFYTEVERPLYWGSLPYAHVGTWKNRVTWNSCLWDCRGSPTNAKIPHLHVHKPKTVVVETV